VLPEVDGDVVKPGDVDPAPAPTPEPPSFEVDGGVVKYGGVTSTVVSPEVFVDSFGVDGGVVKSGDVDPAPAPAPDPLSFVVVDEPLSSLLSSGFVGAGP